MAVYKNVLMCISTTVEEEKWNSIELFIETLVALSLKLNHNGKQNKYLDWYFSHMNDDL